jgi:hypothetical protein
MSVNNKLKDIFQGDDTVKLIGSLNIRWFGHIERIQSQRMPKEIATTTMEETKEYWSGNQWVGETGEDQGKDGLRTLKKIYR